MSWRKHPSSVASQEQHLEEILNNLTEKELETAAKSSYVYFQKPSPETRHMYAKQCAQRFLSTTQDVSKALKRMKETMRFREKLDVDELRKAFEGPVVPLEPLKEHLASGSLYVQGFDKEGRSTYVFVPRKVKRHDDEWTLKEHVYTLERAIACSRACDKTVNAVVDFNGFSLRNAPPTHVGKEFMTVFRKHYAGALNQVYLVDAPMAFVCLWAVFKPILGKKTRDKINFVKSKRSRLGQLYEKDQLAAWMMVGGTKNRDIDVDEYLHQTPFDCAFDEGIPRDTSARG